MTEFLDAQRLARLNPNSFEVCSELELSVLKKGDLVKVCANGERFWVQLTKINWRMLKGTVANELVLNDLELGEEVNFHMRNIFDISIV